MPHVPCTVAYARSILSYDSKTGLLTWKERTIEMFEDDEYWSADTKCLQWNANYASKIAGSTTGKYSRVRIKNKRIGCHRVIWAIVFGYWPSNEIDHKDGNKKNNKLRNLREATDKQNAQNIGMRKGKNSIGIYWNKVKNKWTAEIGIDYKSIRIGHFENKQDAQNAYLDAKKKLHAFQPVPRDL